MHRCNQDIVLLNTLSSFLGSVTVREKKPKSTNVFVLHTRNSRTTTQRTEPAAEPAVWAAPAASRTGSGKPRAGLTRPSCLTNQSSIKLVFVSKAFRLYRSSHFFCTGLFVESSPLESCTPGWPRGWLRRSAARLEHICVCLFVGQSQPHTKFFASDMSTCAQLEFLCREKQLGCEGSHQHWSEPGPGLQTRP